jgi:uncharacterized OsmC-like protein
METEHFGTCKWSPDEEYESYTPHGSVDVFNEGGQRAVELMLLAAAACLNFYLVEYAKARKLAVRSTQVTCNGIVVQSPERVGRIDTHVTIDGDIDDKELKKMVTICERACKVMNTMKRPPEVHVHINRSVGPGASSTATSRYEDG